MKYTIFGIFLFYALNGVGEGVTPVRHIVRIGCPEPKRQNMTKFPWNKHDEEILHSVVSKNRCSVQEPGNPCVTTIFKTGEQDYHVECGKKRPIRPLPPNGSVLR